MNARDFLIESLREIIRTKGTVIQAKDVTEQALRAHNADLSKDKEILRQQIER